jgi:hypothetical protein
VGGNDLFPGYYGMAFSPTNPNTPALVKEVNEVISDLWLNGTLQKIYQGGGAYNADANGNRTLVKYDLWNNSEACIGNFMPLHPTHVANCPPMAGLLARVTRLRRPAILVTALRVGPGRQLKPCRPGRRDALFRLYAYAHIWA